jgi:acyl dehydratase
MSELATPRRTFDARDERFGRWYEELEVGDLYRHWPGKTITAGEDHLFCMLTMAASPIHIDAHYAQTEMDGGRNVVVGTYVYSLVLGMSVPDISGKAIYNLGIDGLRHVRPLYHGDTLYARSTVVEKRPSKSRPGVGIVTVDTEGFNQHDEVVLEFRRSVMLPFRGAGEVRA